VVLEVEGGVLHDELDDGLGGDGLAGEVDGVVLHAVAQEHDLGGGLDHEAQLLLHLVHAHIAPQQQQVLVVLELEQQELEQVHEVLGTGLGLLVEEQQHVLRGAHLLVVVGAGQLVQLLRLLGLAVQLQLVRSGLGDELGESLLRVGRGGHVEHVVFLVDGDDVLLVVDADGSQGGLVLGVFSLGRRGGTSISMKLRSGKVWASWARSALVFLLPCLLK